MILVLTSVLQWSLYRTVVAGPVCSVRNGLETYQRHVSFLSVLYGSLPQLSV